jgi:DNA processing protein
LLALPDADLVDAVGGRRVAAVRRQHARFGASAMRAATGDAGLHVVCRHDDAYPARLRDDPALPAALFVAGGWERFLALASAPAVALVGARRASGYGLEVARTLGRQLAGARVTVVSGMAIGIDAAAHSGALAAGGRTIAVLAGSANRAYPPNDERKTPASARVSCFLAAVLKRHGSILRQSRAL